MNHDNGDYIMEIIGNNTNRNSLAVTIKTLVAIGLLRNMPMVTCSWLAEERDSSNSGIGNTCNSDSINTAHDAGSNGNESNGGSNKGSEIY